jgi:hypothetical protein
MTTLLVALMVEVYRLRRTAAYLITAFCLPGFAGRISDLARVVKSGQLDHVAALKAVGLAVNSLALCYVWNLWGKRVLR